MRFAHPDVLVLLAVLIPALAVFLFWTWRNKQRLVNQFIHTRLIETLTVGVSYARQKLRLVLLFFAVLFALVAWARPQWGFDWQEATTQGLDILIAIDTSKSMLATDISPNRLVRAKLAAYDLLKIAQSDRFGLIAFAGTAFLQCPLTLDEQVFRQSVEALDVNIIPQGGTALGEAINTAAKAFEKSENHKVLILFTDGEDHDGEAVTAAEKAAKDGLRIFTIGIGTREGEMLRIQDDRGNSTFLKDAAGNAVKSRLNEALLQEIATKGNGFYLPLVGTTAMEALYSRGLAPLPRTESTSKLVKNYRERYHWPLGIAIILLLIELFLPHRSRRSAQAQDRSGLKKVTALILLIVLPSAVFASPTAAKKKYEAGQFNEAFAEYQKLLEKKTNDFRLHYNAGDAAYQAGQFDIARKHFETSTIAPDLNLQQRAYYNLGNTLYKIGEPTPDPKEKQEAWQQAIRNFENALRLNANDEDARHNLGFVKQKLEELKQQQQQQQQQQDPSDQDKNEDQKDQQQQKSDQNQEKQDGEQQQQPENQKGEDQQQDQSQQGQQKKDQQQQQQQSENQNQQQQGKPGEEGEEQEAQEGDPVSDGQMTPEQAKQFLDTLKREEKPLIFAPPATEKKNTSGPVKDW